MTPVNDLRVGLVRENAMLRERLLKAEKQREEDFERWNYLDQKFAEMKPEIIHVHGMTFWDWLSEREWPKLKKSLLVAGIILSLLTVIAGLFFCCWFREFGAAWAFNAVFASSLILGLIAIAVGTACLANLGT